MNEQEFSLSCPIPITNYPNVMMAHGGGGKLMQQLIEKMFITAFGNSFLEQRTDSVLLNLDKNKIAFTTDSYVVKPLFFPGGDIGSLAVNGTVNDLSMSGAKPMYISLGMIIEEGLPMETLWQIVNSLKINCDLAGVNIVTGDTKVVDKGKGDGIFINTSGIGIIEHDFTIAPSSIHEGDLIFINGDIGRHGIAIMATRENLEFETVIESDCAPLNHVVQDLLSSGIEIHCMRDLTRGGLVSGLVELSNSSGYEFVVNEKDVPVREDVNGACELMGFDPMFVANEGRFISFIPEKYADAALQILNKHGEGKIIGRVEKKNNEGVTLISRIGTKRILDMISGEQLPRIC
ncbi:MAG: hydrogenase expression/formation protein HypE [Bacteroidetes bacterium]|nr:hydrogenase expression/formation protein HypE [Bacteroidota bacterium]